MHAPMRLPALAAALLVVAVAAGARDVKSWKLDGVSRIEFEGTSGNVILLPAEGPVGRVELATHVQSEDAFRAEVDQNGEVLNLREHWRGHQSSGSVTWHIYLPASDRSVRFSGSTASGDLEASRVAASIRFRTASGNLELADVELGGASHLGTASGDVVLSNMTVVEGTSFSTASGDVQLTDVVVEDDVELSTASGDVLLERVTAGEGCRFSTASGRVRAGSCRGALHLSSASGDVSVRECELTGKSNVSSASGDVTVVLDRMPAHDLSVSSASGDAELAIGSWGDDFRLVLVKRKDRGRLACPFPYTAEDEYEKNDHVYVEKTVKLGSGGPEIEVRSASGDVIVRR